MKTLYYISFPLLIICTAVILIAPLALADDPKAREIMRQVEDRDDGDNQTADMEMILIDKNNKQRIRKIRTFSKDKGPDDLRLMFFMHPADVKDTAFLTFDYDEKGKDDDQWLYLPALKKTKRIASNDKSSSFMGSDLNYSDMTSRNLEDYDYTFYEKGSEMDVNGVKTWVIESTPRSEKVIEESGYKKSLVFVRQDNFFVIRAVNWEKSGGYLKYMDVRNLQKIDGIWTAVEMHVMRKKNKTLVHKTILNWENIKFNQDLDESLFSIRRMEKGL